MRGHSGDPVISGEINWSVSQLRSLFNQGLAAAASAASSAPPGDNLVNYRASPARKQLARQTDRQLGYGDMNYVTMYSPDTGHTDSDQESYV